MGRSCEYSYLHLVCGREDVNACWVGRFHTDPSGTFVRYDAKAIGSGSEAAQSELQDKWHKVRSSRHGIPFAFLTSL